MTVTCSRTVIGTGCLFTIAWLLAASIVANAQEQDSAITIRIPNGWTELPDWMEEGLPFDASDYYGINESDNREVPYLKAFLEINFPDVCDVIPGVVTTTADFEAKVEAAHKRMDTFYELWDRHIEYFDDRGNRIRIESDGVEEFQTLLDEFNAGIDLIRTAQKRDDCFFHVAIDTAAINSHQMITRQVARILGIRCNLDPSHDRAVDDVRMILQLKRDVQNLGEAVAQISLYRSEEICFDWMILRILENPDLERKQLSELVEVLSEHYIENQTIDPAIEASRYEYLMYRQLFRQLETGEYDVEQRSSNWGLDHTLPEPSMVIYELTSLLTYEINTPELRSELTSLALEVPQIGEMLKQLDNVRNKDSKADETELEKFERRMDNLSMDSTVLAPVLLHKLATMNQKDYENEIKILRSRCRQISEACQLGFPDSTEQLRILEDQWTTDDGWKDSKILRWFKPVFACSTLRIKSTLQTNAFLCLAAARQWQLENPGRKTEDLEQIMSAVGINPIPLDPYSGSPLKMAVIDDEIVIYSVGPDGDDDQARKHYDVFAPRVLRGDDNDGDVVFRIVERKPPDH